MDQEQLAEIVKEIEDEKALGKVSAVQVFRSLLNQPDLLSLSSANATADGSGDGYFKFNVNLPRPVLEAETLQLLTANIPLCTPNIPDTACAFWYYRMSQYSGKLPNINNLYFVRLLPSYYKREFIQTYNNDYGFNQTFGGYTDLAAQLKLACAADLAQENYTHLGWSGAPDGLIVPPYYRIQYLKDEVKITYNSTINKFQFAGNQGEALSDRDPQLVANAWSVATAYAVGDRVKDTTYVQGEGYIVYYALQPGTGHALPTYPEEYNTYWSRAYGYEGVADYSAYTPYLVGRYVSYNNQLYKCIQNAFSIQPSGLSTSANYWILSTGAPENPPVYQYLTTGYNDPNVATLQGQCQRQYSPYALFEEGDNVYHNGVVYQAKWQTIGTNWFPTTRVNTAYSATTAYVPGDYVYYTTQSGPSPPEVPGYFYTCILATTGNAPTGALGNNTWWALWLPTTTSLDPVPVPNTTDNAYSSTRTYNVNEWVYYSTRYYICVQTTKGNAPTGAYTNNAYWWFIEYDPARPSGTTAPGNSPYKAGDIVTANTYYSYVPFWRCLKNNPPAGSLTALGTDSRFGLNEWWAPCYWVTGPYAANIPYTGLASISANLDMMDNYAGVTHYPYPEGIPPQPFSLEPHRLLNSILGFSWNGVFTPSMLNIIYDNVTNALAGNTSQLLNRVRPLPIYYQSSSVVRSVGLGYDPTSIQDTFLYSAEGYANLVYTSVVNIYTTIVGGSTLDTQRNTNLIGTCSMNSGNLGIGFFTNFIDGKLRVNMADIYSIGIELRDEAGDPYPLTNNAICSFTFKLTYKERPLENKQ